MHERPEVGREPERERRERGGWQQIKVASAHRCRSAQSGIDAQSAGPYSFSTARFCSCSLCLICQESVKSTFGVGEREPERERWERGQGERYRTEPEEYGRQPTRRHEFVGEERQSARPYAESYLGGKEEPRGYGRPYEPLKGQREYSREEYGAPSSRTSYEQPERIRSQGTDIGSKMQYQQRSAGVGRGSSKFEAY